MGYTSLLVCALFLICVVLHHFERKGMQRTIDRLTDKLMAKDYREYTALNQPPPQEKPARKPLSYYDDPSVEDDTA